MSVYRNGSYVGVSGLVNREQQRELTDYAGNTLGNRTDTMLFLGVKAVHKTQWLDIENKYGPSWYPVGEEAFADTLDVGSDAVAQMYLDPEILAANPQYGTEFIRRVKRRGHHWLNIIQFDLMPYRQNPEAFGYLIHEARREAGLREYKVIVQCHGEAMAEGPKPAIEKLKRLSPDEIDWVLFDASHGKGLEMEPDALRPFLETGLEDPDLAHVGFGVAGGLDAAAVERYIPELLRDFPEISWDAEGRLHRTDDGVLDMQAAKDYLRASGDVIEAA
ncbi:MAG TPA: hypothetical protein VFG56_00790 [Candidatus Saccharimonadales bacterium]|nr:hypothetical protein [Candidatus Saccharimonadales bacterium]